TSPLIRREEMLGGEGTDGPWPLGSCCARLASTDERAARAATRVRSRLRSRLRTRVHATVRRFAANPGAHSSGVAGEGALLVEVSAALRRPSRPPFNPR